MTKINEKYDLENNPSIVYERIQKAWENAGLNSAAEFSMATRNNPNEPGGISPATISKWKKRGEVPSTKSLAIVCDVCGCDMDYLLGRIDTFKYDNHSIQEETGLSEEAINHLRNYREAKKNAGHCFHGDPCNDLIPDFISYILTYEDKTLLYNDNVLENIMETLNRQKIVRKQLEELPSEMKQFCYQSYTDMVDNHGYPDRGWYVFWTKNNFERYLPKLKDEYLGETQENILAKAESYFDLIREDNNKKASYYDITQNLIELLDSFMDQPH